MTWRLLAALVVPLLVAASAAAWITSSGLARNAAALDAALQLQADAHAAYALSLVQDDASKAVLIDREHLATHSAAKIAAYDSLLVLLAELQESRQPTITPIVRELLRIDAEELRPLDTRILEAVFVDVEAARRLYSDEYEPARRRYAAAVDALVVAADELSSREAAATEAANQRSVAGVVVSLFFAIAMVGGTVWSLGGRVERSRSDVRALLVGMEEGLVSFDRAGVLSAARSHTLSTLIPGSAACTTLEQLLALSAGTPSETVQFALEMLWEPEDGFISSFADTTTFLPAQAEVQGRLLSLTYRPHYDADQRLSSVFVVVRDVTEVVRLKNVAAARAEWAERIILAVRDREAWGLFVMEASSLIDQAQRPLVVDDDVRRPLHTLKGALGLYRHDALATEVHRLEDALDGGLSARDVRAGLDRIRGTFESEVREIEMLLGDAQGTVLVDRGRMDVVLALAAGGESELADAVQTLLRRPVSDLFERHRTQIAYRCGRMGRTMPRVRVDGDELSRPEFERFEAALGHLVRNGLDHGLETALEREAMGKSPAGLLALRATRTPEGIRLVWMDDGRGIDTDKLVAKAVARGIWTPERASQASHGEALELMFMARLSTRAEVTQTSGRGMGMSAAREHLEKQGGYLRVTSKSGVGSTFEMFLPTAGSRAQQVVRATG